MPPWTMLIDPLSRLLDKIIPDPQARENAEIELKKAEREADLQEFQLAISADAPQAATNQQEADSPALFVSGWRPFIGWVCGAAFAYHFLLQPVVMFIMASLGRQVALPSFDMQTLTTVLMGMLGLGSLRTLEKIKGAS